VLERTWTLWV